jgi:hypothetical protein
MKNVLERLITIQDLQLKRGRQTAATKEEITRLRADIPEPILAHFDRMLARGKKGVAIANHGVCMGCHLKISSGTWGNLQHSSDIHLCDSCGRYLYRPPETETAPPQLAPPRVKARKRTRNSEIGLAASGPLARLNP